MLATFAALFRSRAALQSRYSPFVIKLGVLQRSVKRPKLTVADRFLWSGYAMLGMIGESPWSSSSRRRSLVGTARLPFVLTWKIRGGTPADRRSEGCARIDPDHEPRESGWGAPRIHGNCSSSHRCRRDHVSKYLVRARKPPFTWRTFLDNHIQTWYRWTSSQCQRSASRSFYVFLVLAHDRRRIVHFAVTAIRLQNGRPATREAFPWDSAPRYSASRP